MSCTGPRPLSKIQTCINEARHYRFLEKPFNYADWKVWGDEIRAADVASGSIARVRHNERQTFILRCVAVAQARAVKMPP